MLSLHRAERLDVLADALAELLATPLSDPFVAEVVAVPARGVERWLAQRLSASLGATAADSADGVCANVAFVAPARLVADVVAIGVSDATDPWQRDRLVWHVLAALLEFTGTDEGAVLARQVDGGTRGVGRRLAAAEAIATLFLSYGSQRPQLLVDWAAGDDSDGCGGAVPAQSRWQPMLFRAVRSRIGTPSPGERLRAACDRLSAHPDSVNLPERLSVFGATRLGAAELTVLRALGNHREVHLWLPHASPVLWDRVRDVSAAPNVTARAGFAAVVTAPRRADVPSPPPRNALLSSLSREVRELETRLLPLIDADAHHGGAPLPTTLLGQLQAALRDDTPAGSAPPALPAAADGSVEFHTCHGPARMVEIVRERLLRLFEDDPTLEPRDVLISCPDVETYAPLIKAAFGHDATAGPGSGHPGHRLRVRLADRSIRFTNPVLEVALALLRLADSRVTAAELLDLAAAEPVRTRFRFTEDELATLRTWAADTNVRWALDETQRQRFGLGGFPQNTALVGLDRLLLGVAADDDANGWLGTAVPLDGVEGTLIDLVGRYAAFLDALRLALTDLDTAVYPSGRPAADWTEALLHALTMLTDTAPADAWQDGQARREIADATPVESSGDVGPAPTVSLADVRGLLERRIAARPARSNFRTGELTVCSLVPMRSVPHRVLILLGLDDDAFPRSTVVSGDDVLGEAPCAGERDPRAEDRQLLLDTVMSASDRVLVFYTGADLVTGARRPPAVPISELRDAVAGLAGGNVLAAATTAHPLQPFDIRNFIATRPVSFDPAAFAGAVASQQPPQQPRPFLSEALGSTAPGDVQLDDLVAFCEHPVQSFIRTRLGVALRGTEEDVSDTLAVTAAPLDEWSLGDRMLTTILDGNDLSRSRRIELLRGSLPPFQFGARSYNGVSAKVEGLAAAALAERPTDAPQSRDISIDLGDDRRLVGTIGGIRGGSLYLATYASIAPKHRMAMWVRLLALASAAAAADDAPFTGNGILVGRHWQRPKAFRFAAPPNPVSVLRDLIDLRDSGLRAPLPVAPKSSEAYAATRARGDSDAMATEAARREYHRNAFADQGDRFLQMAFVGGFDELLDPACVVDNNTFARCAFRLWEPLLTGQDGHQ